MCYTIKQTTVYRVPTVADALQLRKKLEKSEIGTLTSFKYVSKAIKEKGEIVEEYQLVTVIMELDNEKEPEGVACVDLVSEEF